MKTTLKKTMITKSYSVLLVVTLLTMSCQINKTDNACNCANLYENSPWKKEYTAEQLNDSDYLRKDASEYVELAKNCALTFGALSDIEIELTKSSLSIDNIPKLDFAISEAKKQCNANETIDNQESKNQTKLKSTKNQSDPKKEIEITNSQSNLFIIGNWHGTLRNKPLELEITNVKEQSIQGKNTVSNNTRLVYGKIEELDTLVSFQNEKLKCLYKIVLNEPGDDEWDGVFTIYLSEIINTNNNNVEKVKVIRYRGVGNWVAYNGKLKGEVNLYH